jgi:hypothetical protein
VLTCPFSGSLTCPLNSVLGDRENHSMLNCEFVGIAALAGLVAFVGDFAIPFVLAFFYPNYNHLKLVQSELGTKLSPVSIWMNLWWVFFGFLCILFSIGFAQAFAASGGPVRVVATMIIIFGLGAGIGAGLFPQEPGGAETTVSGKLHGICAGIGELAIIIVPLLNLWVFSKVVHPALYWGSLVAFILSAFIFSLFLCGKNAPPRGVLSYVGLWQRAYFLIVYLYLGTIAVEMIRVARLCGPAT